MVTTSGFQCAVIIGYRSLAAGIIVIRTCHAAGFIFNHKGVGLHNDLVLRVAGGHEFERNAQRHISGSRTKVNRDGFIRQIIAADKGWMPGYIRVS